jgi:hypothetical protein
MAFLRTHHSVSTLKRRERRAPGLAHARLTVSRINPTESFRPGERETRSQRSPKSSALVVQGFNARIVSGNSHTKSSLELHFSQKPSLPTASRRQPKLGLPCRQSCLRYGFARHLWVNSAITNCNWYYFVKGRGKPRAAAFGEICQLQVWRWFGKNGMAPVTTVSAPTSEKAIFPGS